MAFRRYVLPILVFVLFVGGAYTMFLVVDAGSDSADRTPEYVENESINQQVGLWQFTNKALDQHTAGFNESVTVYNASDHELTKGEDYQWNASDGSIKYENTNDVTDGNTGTISYHYFENTEDVKGLSRVIGPLAGLVGQGGLLVGGLAIVVMLLAFAGLVSRFFSGNDFQSNR